MEENWSSPRCRIEIRRAVHLWQVYGFELFYKQRIHDTPIVRKPVQFLGFFGLLAYFIAPPRSRDWWWWILLLLPCGAYKGSALVFVIILYLDYRRALILLNNCKAHLLLGLSLPFSAIPPAAAGVVPHLRTWSVISAWTYVLLIGLDPFVQCDKLLPKHVYYV